MTDSAVFPTLEEALAAFDAGKLSEALAGCEIVVALDPASAQAWHFKGNVYSAMRDVSAALACFDRALWLDPDIIDCCFDRAMAEKTLGLYADAMKDLQHMLELNPKSSHARQQLALIRQSQKTEASAAGACIAASDARQSTDLRVID